MYTLTELAGKNNGILKTSDFKSIGYTKHDIRILWLLGTIKKVMRGYYLYLKHNEEIDESKVIAGMFPDGVLCMCTALFYYGYCDQVPLRWDIAVDKDTSKSRCKIEFPSIQPYYIEKAHLEYGITNADYDTCSIKIFDRDRLICEIIKSENKIDKETYNKAIKYYLQDENKNISNLIKYARKRNMLNKIRSRIGVHLSYPSLG